MHIPTWKKIEKCMCQKLNLANIGSLLHNLMPEKNRMQIVSDGDNFLSVSHWAHSLIFEWNYLNFSALIE